MGAYEAKSRQLIDGLSKFGVAGVLSYGMFNTLYYVGAFLLFWNTTNAGEAARGLGVAAAAREGTRVLLLVWAGSQVTKLLRAGAALALAPLVDRGLRTVASCLRVSRPVAFSLLTLSCFAIAAAVFGAAVLTTA